MASTLWSVKALGLVCRAEEVRLGNLVAERSRIEGWENAAANPLPLRGFAQGFLTSTGYPTAWAGAVKLKIARGVETISS